MWPSFNIVCAHTLVGLHEEGNLDVKGYRVERLGSVSMEKKFKTRCFGVDF